jgi:tetratricopeptide (TPR) repeat protein
MARSDAPLSPASPASSADRVIRVFISSTFRDMHAEREELLKFVFPKLRHICESRGVVWGEVDLRWGITDEQKAEVVPICLKEIRRCRPYFIGILGERYGSAPDPFPESLVAEESWLERARDRSVTELEILHGVLNDPDMAAQAFFYFRDPAYIESLPEWERQVYRETPAGAEKLARLKDRIRASPFPVRENYRDPRDLGRLVLEDMTRLIDTLFPEGEPPDTLGRETAGQEAYIRALSQVYVTRPADFDVLDRHAASSGPPLLVTGEPGCGKSALLANWVKHFREKHPDIPVITHFVLATSESLKEAVLLRRLGTELGRAFGLDLEPPAEASGMREFFSRALMMTGDLGRAVVVIDGLERLEDRSRPSDANWLPEEFPPGIRLVIGCSPEGIRLGTANTPDPVIEVLARRGWPVHVLDLLAPDDRRAVVRKYLELSGKTLSRPHEDMIVASEHSANPLFLKTLIEELRQFGSHDELEGRIAHYLQAPSVPALFSLILARYEEDYERDRPGLVGDAFSFFYVADRGLAESELLDLLGTDGAPLPQAIWAPLFLAAEGLLADRGGMISLNSPLIRVALVAAFAGPGSAVAMNRRLAEYFRTRENGPRKLEELPYQLWMADDMAGLRDVMADLPFMEALVEHDLDAAANIWERLEKEGFDFYETYKAIFKDPLEHGDYVGAIFLLMAALGHVHQAVAFGTLLAAWAKLGGDTENAARALNNLGVQCKNAGQFDQALKVFDEAESLSRKNGKPAQLVRALTGRSGVAENLGDLDLALTLNAEAEKICRDLGDRNELAGVLQGRARILEARGDVKGARPLYEEAVRLDRETGRTWGLATALLGLANLSMLAGDLEAAEKHLVEVESLFRRGVSGYLVLGSYLAHKGTLAVDLGRHEEALRLFGQMQDLGTEQGDVQLAAKAKEHAAVVRYNLREFEAALALYLEVEQTAREIKHRGLLLESVTGQANCRHALKETNQASKLYCEAEGLCVEMGLRNRLVELLGDHASLLYVAGRFDEAHALWDRLDAIVLEIEDGKTPTGVLLHKADCALIESNWDEARHISEELGTRIGDSGDDETVHGFFSIRARLFYHDQDYDGSLALYSRMEALARKRNDTKGLAEALGGKALCLHFLKDDDRAVAAFVEAESVAKELGRWDWLADNTLHRSRILRDVGRIPEALEASRALAEAAGKAGRPDLVRAALIEQYAALFDMKRLGEAEAVLSEWERACREAGDLTGLRMSLNNKATLLISQGKPAEAIPALAEAADLARKLGNGADLSRMLGRLATALYSAGKASEARAALAERETLCRTLGDAKDLAETLNMRGWDLSQSGDDSGAIVLFAEAEKLYRELGDNEGLRDSLLYLAQCHYRAGRYAEAANCSEQGEVLDRQAGKKDRLQVDLGFRAAALGALNRQAEAIRVYEEQEALLRDLGRTADLAICLSNQANVHRSTGDAQSALKVYPEAERAAREAGDKATLAQVLADWSEILIGLAAWDEALAVWSRAEADAIERGDQRGLWYYRYVQAHTLAYRKQDARAALAKVEDLMKLPGEAAPDENSLKAVLEMRTQLLAHLGRRS